MKRFLFVLFLSFSIFCLNAAAAEYAGIKNRVSEFTLANGLKFILVEDHSVPIASFFTYVDVGSCDERIGIYGISHILEHLAFKGTSEVGTTDYAAEKKLLDRLDVVFAAILAERDSLQPNQEKIAALDKELRELMDKAGKYVVTNELDTIYKRQGGTGLNAMTSNDFTVYVVSLPSNKIELWAYMETARFTDPVFREFYKEKDVIMEERRVGDENQPIGRLIEQFCGIAYLNHPYRVGVVGPMSNLQHISNGDVKNYFQEHYSAKNMVVGVSGDITPAQLRQVAEKYFLKIRPGIKAPRICTIDPDQPGEKTVTLYEESQPWLLIGYHCSSVRDDDFAKFSILDNILTSGRTARLNKKLTIVDKSALVVQSFAGFPGTKYPSLYVILALPNSGHTTAELQKDIYAEIERIQSEPVSADELQSAKVRYKADFFRQLQSNWGLLLQLLMAEEMMGSWQNMFTTLDKLEKVTAQDIQNLAKKYLIEKSRIVGRIESKGEVTK